jgi:c-di-GMP-binding flagellar brake protein YcgR
MSRNPRHFRQERREFIRVREQCPVEYRFIGGADGGFHEKEPCLGATDNISGGGLKLVGPLPNLDWVPELLIGRMAVGLQLRLPGEEAPVSAIARVAWMEVENRKSRRFLMGLRFMDISRQDRERIVQFIIRAQVP